MTSASTCQSLNSRCLCQQFIGSSLDKIAEGLFPKSLIQTRSPVNSFSALEFSAVCPLTPRIRTVVSAVSNETLERYRRFCEPNSFNAPDYSLGLQRRCNIRHPRF